MNQVANIPIDKIRPSQVLLRQVDCSTLKYKELVNSIRDVGILHSLAVRPAADEGYYDLVEGHHRYSAALDIGLLIVPCTILEGVDSDLEIIRRQIQASFCGKPATLVEAGKHIRLLLSSHQDLTFDDLAAMLNMQASWLRKCLALDRLHDKAKTCLVRGEISVTAGMLLSSLPVHLQEDMLPFAIAMPLTEFKRKYSVASKAFREARKQDRLLEYGGGFNDDPEPWLRSLKEIHYELDFATAGSVIVGKNQNAKPIEIWKAALAWVLHLDADSVGAFKARRDREEAERAANFLERKEARNLLKRMKDRGLVVPVHLEDIDFFNTLEE